MGTLRVKNVSDGLRYGWREPNKRRDELIKSIDKIEKLEPASLGDTLAKQSALEKMHVELNSIRTQLVPVLPDQIIDVPESEQPRFLAHLTDDWAPVEPSDWAPGVVVRKTIAPKDRPAARLAQGLLDVKDRLIEFDASGKRVDPRALQAKSA